MPHRSTRGSTKTKDLEDKAKLSSEEIQKNWEKLKLLTLGSSPFDELDPGNLAFHRGRNAFGTHTQFPTSPHCRVVLLLVDDFYVPINCGLCRELVPKDEVAAGLPRITAHSSFAPEFFHPECVSVSYEIEIHQVQILRSKSKGVVDVTAVCKKLNTRVPDIEIR